jgi:hypothetical protein
MIATMSKMMTTPITAYLTMVRFSLVVASSEYLTTRCMSRLRKLCDLWEPCDDAEESMTQFSNLFLCYQPK